MATFKEQVSLLIFYLDLLYAVAAMSVVLVVLGLCLVDAGLVRTKNQLDTWVLKIAAAMIGGLSTILVGYAIWSWSFNTAFGVPDPLTQAFKDWWLFGNAMTEYAAHLDPKKFVEADVQQVFVAFFMTFSMATMALIHSAVVERIKARPLLVLSVLVGAILSPLAGYLAWGPVSPLTNRGVHDFDGIFPLYIFAGAVSLVLAWRCGPRRGVALGGQPSASERPPAALAMTGAGLLLIMFALPFIALGSGWVFPDVGYFGISMTTSGMGIVVINVLTSFLVGGAVGTYIAYKKRQPAWIFLGSISSAILCGTLFDVGMPWEVALVSLFGPLVTLFGQRVMISIGIDEPKVVPLALFNGVIGAIVTGFVAWGTKTGGFLGLEGEYGFQNAEITPWWQLVGVVAILVIAIVPTYLLALVFERTSGLVATDVEQDAGLDNVNWDTPPVDTPPVRVVETPLPARPS